MQTASRCTLATVDQQRDWDAFVELQPGAAAYHRYAGSLLIEQLYGHRAYPLVARDAQRIVGVLPLVLFDRPLLGRHLVSLPFFDKGGLFHSAPAAAPALWQAAVDLARELKASTLELRSDAELPLEADCRQAKVSFHLEVHDGEDAVWKRVGPKVRNQVRKAERAGLTVGHGGAELLTPFYAVFCENMRDLGTPVLGRPFFEAALDRFLDRTAIFAVFKHGEPIAASFCFQSEHKLEVPWASHLKRFNRDNPNMLLYWAMIRHAARSSVARFDFGRGTRDGGTYRFKKQWRGKEVQHYWYYWFAGPTKRAYLRPENPIFELPIKAWQRLPLWAANWLGPKIVKHIP